MALLNILHYPDPRLRTKAQPVKEVDEAIRRQIRDMFETMYAAPGIGLAATQVDFHQRLIVMDVSEDKTSPLTLINPEIISQEGEQQYDEGCLSVPGFYEPVDRAAKIRVRALDKDGQLFELDADGLLAVCIQHEMDHLEGKLFVDYLTEMKRQRIRKKLIKQQKHEAVSL
jgi:peptide deformylase